MLRAISSLLVHYIFASKLMISQHRRSSRCVLYVSTPRFLLGFRFYNLLHYLGISSLRLLSPKCDFPVNHRYPDDTVPATTMHIVNVSTLHNGAAEGPRICRITLDVLLDITLAHARSSRYQPSSSYSHAHSLRFPQMLPTPLRIRTP